MGNRLVSKQETTTEHSFRGQILISFAASPTVSDHYVNKMSGSDENGSPGMPEKPEGNAAPSEHLNIKVTDNNNEVFFKIKRTTALKKLMDAFCERQGKAPNSVRFLFDGSRVQATDSPDTVRITSLRSDLALRGNAFVANTISNSSICRMVIHSKSIRSRLEARTKLSHRDTYRTRVDLMG